ncbi:hypothetical protein [Pseudomonas sp. dw_358]|uniref:hypothetical protein n=1 Tax=Pseudomonas sp. dw_358 TaxID=2720083 RepID=UPI001BD58392|nr:hypothetical protein [Pseudomonas sp. dw_358]
MIISYLPLEKWRKNWHVNGTHIVCRHCHMVWDLANAKRPFTHAHDCKAKRDATPYPLRDLRQISEALHQTGLC